jgi:6-pyruvoyltetrahydropterin/6-carboxytetrahydropterin synthase
VVYTTAQRFHFSASHRLDGLAPHHPEARNHGHNYVVEVHLAADELDASGLVADCRRLSSLKRYVEEHLDRQVLNDILPGQPSCERIAQHLYERCMTNLEPSIAALVHEVRVSDTPSSWATFRPTTLTERSANDEERHVGRGRMR